MLMIYGAQMPLRILEEIRYWKMQEKEYMLFMIQLVPDLEPNYLRLLKEWEDVLTKTENTAEQWIESIVGSSQMTSHQLQEQIHSIIYHSLNQSQEFVRQLFQLMQHSRVIIGKPKIKLIIQHITRESEYFIGIMHAVLSTNHSSNSDVSADNESELSQHDTEALEQSREQQRPVNGGIMEGTWSEPISQRPVPIGGHILPPLPYPYDALEPYIDEKTMKLHHDKHHQAYVEGLNKAEKMMEQARTKNDYDLIKHWEREAAFNGAGHYLHTIFWDIMSPEGGGKATGPIAAQINKDFGSFDKFKAHFSNAAKNVEGSGWAILVWSPRSHRLEILQAEKHQNLTQWDVIPLLVLDVWEHAYYIKYQNQREQYINAWWNIVNWNAVNDRFVKARTLKWIPY